MRRFGLPSAILAVVVAHLFFLAEANAEEKPPRNEFVEPELQLEIEFDGTKKTAELGLQTLVEVGGKQLPVTIRAKEYRTLSVTDLKFNYPRHLAFEVDTEDVPSIVIWTLDGNNVVIIVQRYPKLVGNLTSTVVSGLIEQFGKENVDQSKVSMELAGKTRNGVRLDATLFDDVKLRQEVFSLSGSKYNYALILQDSLSDDGEESKEMVNAKKLLKESLELVTLD